MRRRRLWCVVLISGLGALLITTAKPINERVLKAPRWEHVNQTCRTRDCNDAVNQEQLRSIQSYMNPSADPCDSFYEYSCGNWRREHPHDTTVMMKGNDQLTSQLTQLFENWLAHRELAEHEGVVELNSRRSLAERNQLPERKELAEITELTHDVEKMPLFERKQDENEILYFESNSDWNMYEDLVWQKMLTYYRTCKSQNTIGQPSLREYYEVSKSDVKWQLNDYDWVDALAGIGRFGYSSHFLIMHVVQKNVSVHRVVICPHELDSQLNISDEMYEVLRDFTNKSQTALQQNFDALENDLQKLNCQYCEHAHDEGDETEECDCYRSDPMTYSTLTTRMPETDWQRYLSPQLGRQLQNDDIIEIANLDLVKLQLEYVRQIDKELNLLYTLARFLNYVQQQRLHLVRHETVELNCIHHMRKVFNMPLNYLYERGHYSSDRNRSQPIIEDVFEELKLQFESMIVRNKMQFETHIQQKLKSKLQHINVNIGNLPKNVSTQFYYDYIGAYNFSDDFSYNHMHALKVFYKHFNALMDASEQELQQIWHSFDLHPPIYPDTLDASPYYNARTNLIVITYAYLQLPFYDASFWPAFIYGDLASTLGHELIHAFDTEFLKFNENGNPDAQPLKSMFLNENFRKNHACLQRGTVFEQERMSDVSGARLALNTFLRLDPNALERNGELYFLQFSQFFCAGLDQGDASHDINRLRLDYVLGVLPEFSNVFNCPLGSRMNPYEKCEMYT